MHSTHFIYGYMASDIWSRTTQIAREETHCRHMGYSFRLAARALLYASSHRQDKDRLKPTYGKWDLIGSQIKNLQKTRSDGFPFLKFIYTAVYFI